MEYFFKQMRNILYSNCNSYGSFYLNNLGLIFNSANEIPSTAVAIIPVETNYFVIILL